MELDRYLHMVMRYWYIPCLLGLASILGTVSYLRWTTGDWTGASTATATVAVLEPAVTRAASGQQAQINFASVAESQTVGERVSQRLGLDQRPEARGAKVSVRLARTLVPSVPTPLYFIQVQHRDPEVAKEIAAAYVEEARDVFVEMNALAPDQVDAALQGEEDHIRNDLAAARAALWAFEEEKDAWRLTSRVDTQVAFINTLKQSSRTVDIGGATASAARTDAEKSLVTAQGELNRLRALQPESDRLTLDVTLMTASLAQLSGRESDLALRNDTAGLEGVRAEMTTTRSRLAQARAAVVSFQQSNGIGDLGGEIATKSASVADLRRQVVSANVNITGLDAAILVEDAELQRLRTLQPDYERLAVPVQTGEAKLAQLQLRKVDIVVAGSLPPGVLVKVLDPPHLQSNVASSLILYVVTAGVGLLAGLVLVYIVGYFDRTLESAGQAEEMVGAPVLARVPRAF